MNTSQLKLLVAGLIFLTQPVFSQNVKLAHVALGMNEAEAKGVWCTSVELDTEVS
jgi:hypothetical protein